MHPHASHLIASAILDELYRNADQARTARLARRTRRRRATENLPSTTAPWPPVRHDIENRIEDVVPPPLANAS